MWLLPLLLLAATPAGSMWDTRMENAAVRLREASTQLADTATEVAQAGRLRDLAVLHSDADEVVLRANQILLWANQAPSLAAPPPPPGPDLTVPPKRPRKPR